MCGADEDFANIVELIRGKCWVTHGAAGGVPLLICSGKAAAAEDEVLGDFFF